MQGEEERKDGERAALQSWADLSSHIVTHHLSTIQFTFQSSWLKDPKKEIEREWVGGNRRGEGKKREREQSTEKDSLNYRGQCRKVRASTFVLLQSA